MRAPLNGGSIGERSVRRGLEGVTMGATHGMVVVGAGLAGAKAAETLRKEGFDGPVTLVGEEPYRPYERPPLSKGYLLGSEEREKAFVHPEAWYAEHDVELRLASRVVAIDVSAHEVQLADDERLPYQALLLATGAEPVRLPVPGADLPGVHYLRRLPDSDALKEAFVGATAREGGVVVIGGGVDRAGGGGRGPHVRAGRDGARVVRAAAAARAGARDGRGVRVRAPRERRAAALRGAGGEAGRGWGRSAPWGCSSPPGRCCRPVWWWWVSG
jgi:NAD(P)H-nitrite reductase